MKSLKSISYIRALPFLFVSGFGCAAPGAPSDTPLVISGAAKPNIMILIDSSGSMNNIVPDDPYDETVNYSVGCTDTTITSGPDIHIHINQSSGKTYFDWNGSNYDWGTANTNSSGTATGLTGKKQHCFQKNSVYQAFLNGNKLSSGEYVYDGNSSLTDYTGNYLNWYFSNNAATSPTGFTIPTPITPKNGQVVKPGTSSRNLIAIDATNSIVDGLSGSFVGVSKYHSSKGADILKNLSDVDTNRAAIKTSLSGIGAAGSTPLIAAYRAIGGYYTTSNSSDTLTLHPGGSSSTATASTLFPAPNYSDGVPATKPIRYSCQKSFFVTVTDGIASDNASGFNDYDGDGSKGLDDVSMAMYDMDLRIDLTGKQNITSYLIGFADPLVQTDALLTATGTQGGGAFFAATNSAQLASALAATSASIQDKSAAAASVAFNSSTLSTTSAVFFAKFNSSKWSGELHAINLSDTGALETDDWEASAKLDDDTVLTPSSRVIITNDGTDGVPFRWTAAGVDKTSPAEPMVRKDLKNDNSANSAADANGSLRLDYLRGIRTNEASTATPKFRSRASRLGDIVNSSPIYVGAPQSNWPDFAINNKFGSSTNVYSAFRTAQAGRTPVVYVGANDGMLHGFNAQLGSGNTSRGKELIAYVPRAAASDLQNLGLHYLTSPSYSHKYYVDLTPTIADVFISPDNVVANRDWRTVLVGGLRQGGKGYFALDVTNPTNFTEANAASLVLWEFTDANDADMGYSYSEPTIAMMNNGKWAVIFGNGYNSTNGVAKLFILYLEQGADGTWAAGDYVKLDTKSGGTPLSTNGNGLSSPQAADLNGDGTVDRIYAGDLKGQMWAFDVSDASDANWSVAYGTAAAPAPLFSAKDTSNNAQPITARPLLARNIDNAGGAVPNIVVMFGTGQYITQGDITSTQQQSFYVVGDVGTGSLLRSNLLQRTFTTSGSLRSPTASQATLDWSAKSGWFMDLAAGTASPALSAERVVTQASLRRRTLFFNTIIPDSSPCVSGGAGWLMSFDFLTGLNPGQGTFDANNDGVINASDMPYIGQLVSIGLPAKSGFLGSKQYTPTSSDSDSTLVRDVNTGASALEGRLGWEELRAK